MKALLYLIGANIKGWFRSIKRKKSQLILIVFVAAMFSMVLFANEEAGELTQWIPDEYLSTAFAALALLVAGFTVNNGIEKGSSSFRKADTQFVFPSPISPKLILLFGFLKQLGISLLVVLWFMFQSFNIRQMFGLSYDGFYIFLITVFIAVAYMPVSSMLIYSVTLRNDGAKSAMRKIFLWFWILFATAFIILMIITGDPFDAAKTLIGTKVFEYIPIVGWLTVLLKGARWGFTAWTWGAVALLAAGLCVIMWRLLSSDIPFYEDVLKQTDDRESAIQRKRSGGSNLSLGPKKAKKASINYKGTGAKALFYRQLLEYKKSGFMFVDKISIIMLVIGVGGGFILKNSGAPLYIMLYVSIYMNFLFAFSGKWIKELSTPFIYLIPGSPMGKLWYATAANHIKHLADGAFVFIPLFIITGGDMILCAGYILAYAAIGSLFVYSDVLARRLFGSLHNGTFTNLLKVLSILVLTAPAIVAFIITNSLFGSVKILVLLSPVLIALYCAVISIIIMLTGRKIFSNTELT